MSTKVSVFVLAPVMRKKSTEMKKSIAGGVNVFIKQQQQKINNSSQTLKSCYELARRNQLVDHEELQIHTNYLEALFSCLRFCWSHQQPEDAAAGPQTMLNNADDLHGTNSQ